MIVTQLRKRRVFYFRLNTRVSHSLLGSRQVRIVLFVPVHLEWSNQAAKAYVHKVSDVSEETTAERRHLDSIIICKVWIPGHIQPFIRRHSQPEDLITLTEK